MKKIIPIVLLWLLYAFQSEATNDGVYLEKVQECEEYQNILDIEEDAMDMLQSGYGMEYFDEISESDVQLDYSRMYKVYVDTGIENAGTNDAEIIKEYIEKSDYFWSLPVEVNGNKLELTYGKHREPLTNKEKLVLSEEQIAEYESNMGKWVCQGVSIGVRHYLSETLEEVGQQVECEEAVIVESIPGFHYGVGITFHNQKAENVLSLNEPYPLMEKENVEKIRKSKRFFEKNDLEAGVFDFSQAMELSNAFERGSLVVHISEALNSVSIGVERKWILLGGLGIILFVGCGFLIRKKKN
ncbi:hypothetical protein M2454_000552 [Aequitasia blattaphilus]|uniref:Uncharacterized protein n=1 Tax=Aequitasia blattaphilus TaxID=2949332 RepID=A0ABT1E8S0_9FIRM|nr:hypothetical protein [Aequitasia blattaphilus]MCP1102229.1 hypothetical protein [Aequitasia blattaphilus]MCR8614869.1 hypothetical protein [Aequitasia blattaphilus]